MYNSKGRFEEMFSERMSRPQKKKIIIKFFTSLLIVLQTLN